MSILSFRVALVIVYISFIDISSSQNTDTNKLATYFWQKCQNVTRDNKFFDKIYYESGKLSEELSYAFQNLPQNKGVFCKDNRPSLVGHLNSIATDLEACLLPREKYLSEFVRVSFSQFLHFLCHNDGENVDKFFRASATRCRSALESDADNKVGNCFEKIFKPSAGYLAKKDLCDDMNTAKKCFDVILDEKCSTYQSYKQLNTELFKYISKPCSSCVAAYSVVLLIASLLISYFAR